MHGIENRVVLVTGASRGIGLETARLFREAGARVIICARGEPGLDEAIRDTGARGVLCDVSDGKDVGRLFEVISREFGRIDIVVNNAGIFRSIPLLETSDEVFDDVIRINLRGVFLVSRAAFRLMSQTGGGHIINVSSQAGKQAYEGSAAYCASKFGVAGLSKVLALEGRERGIRVSVLYPGAVDTSVWDGITDDREGFLQPGEVAGEIMSLAASDSDTGTGELGIIPSST